MGKRFLSLGSWLAATPLLALAQGSPPAPRYYVGVGLYTSDYQRLTKQEGEWQVPVQVAAGYQLRPRLAVQLGGVLSTRHQQYASTTGYYTSHNGTTGYRTFFYSGSSTSRTTSLRVLARYALTRRPGQRFQVDALGGIGLEQLHYTEYTSATAYDSANTSLGTLSNRTDDRSREALLVLGLGPRFQLSRHLEATLDFTLATGLFTAGRGRTGAAALGLRYRFGRRG